MQEMAGTIVYYTDWLVSFCIAILNPGAYFGSLAAAQWRGGSKPGERR
jgi:hypothetical protein